MDLHNILMSIPDTHVVSIVGEGENLYAQGKPISEIQEEADSGERILFVSLTSRPGAMIFATELEHEHFPPDEDSNDLFGMYFAKWDMGGMLEVISIVSVPAGILEIATEIATKHGLVPKKDLVMACLSSEGMVQFPLHGENVYIFENAPGHPIYSAGPGGQQDIRHDELSDARKFQRKTIDRMNKK